MNWIFKLFKITLFIFNSFYFLFSIILLISAGFLYINSNQLNDFIKLEYEQEYIELIYAMISFALVLVLIGFVGCSGILNEKPWLLIIYFSSLFIIFILQFTGAIYLYVKSVDYFNSFKRKIIIAIKNHYGSSSIHSNAIDYLHLKLKCCGWFSPRDWDDSSYVDPQSLLKIKNYDNLIKNADSFPLKIPHSCCVNNYDLTCVLMHKFHEVGCENMVKVYYKHTEMTIAWIMASLNMFQLVLLILSLYLLCMIIFNNKTNKKDDLNSTTLTEEFDQDNINYIHNPNSSRYYMTSAYL